MKVTFVSSFPESLTQERQGYGLGGKPMHAPQGISDMSKNYPKIINLNIYHYGPWGEDILGGDACCLLLNYEQTGKLPHYLRIGLS